MLRLHAGLGVVGAFVAAAACGGGVDEVVLTNTAGAGGSSAVGGTGGTGNVSGSAGAGGSAVCTGLYGQAGGSPLSEAIKCYISEPAQAEAECLPVNDPTLLLRLGDFMSSEGYVPVSVLDFAEKVPLSASCEPLLECCSSIAEQGRSQRCGDMLENPRSPTLIDGCPVQNPRDYGTTTNRVPPFRDSFDCSETSEVDAGQSRDAGDDAATGQRDAGSPEAPSHSLCCYDVCRYLHWP